MPTLKLTLTDLTLVWFETDNGHKRMTALFPDARMPRRGADGLPLPVHRPVFMLQSALIDPGTGGLLQPTPWLLDGEDFLIELTSANPLPPLSLENEPQFKQFVPSLYFALNGPPPVTDPIPANIHPDLLQPVPKRGLVAARLRQADGETNHGVQTGIVRTTTPPMLRTPVFRPLDATSGAGEFPAPSECFAQGLEYEVTADQIVLRAKRFGEGQPAHRSLTLPNTSDPIVAVLGNFSDGYIFRNRSVDRDYDWFYELLQTTPHRDLRRVPFFETDAAAQGGGDCMGAHGGI